MEGDRGGRGIEGRREGGALKKKREKVPQKKKKPYADITGTNFVHEFSIGVHDSHGGHPLGDDQLETLDDDVGGGDRDHVGGAELEGGEGLVEVEEGGGGELLGDVFNEVWGLGERVEGKGRRGGRRERIGERKR
jgi:hypothetical protein